MAAANSSSGAPVTLGRGSQVPVLATSSSGGLPCSGGPVIADGRKSFPDLVNKIEVSGDIHGVVQMPGKDAVISASSDRSVRVYLLRDSGQYWPSVCHYMGAAATALHYNHQQRKVFVGLENGMITEFTLSEDCNRLDHVKDYHAHQNRVTGIHYSSEMEWLLSGARDKYFQFHCVRSGRRLGGYLCAAWVTAIDYDEEAKYAFVGDYSGQITVCKLDAGGGVQLVNHLKGHNGSVQSLHWDGTKGWLYSGSFDCSVFVWDIGGRKGTVYELHGHRQKVTNVKYLAASKQLLSAGEDGHLILWDMSVGRTETSDWSDSDNCQLCNMPFFWNFKAMYDQKQIGRRQHHCRKCGKAICDVCSPKRSPLPYKGHEIPVRICEECCITLSAEDTKSLAVFHDLKHGIGNLSFDENRKILVTSGSDHILKIWNLSSVL